MSKEIDAPPLIAEEDKQFLLKKLWCHGQLLSPLQGILTFIWCILQYKNILLIEFIYSVISIILLPLWSFMSWRSMNRKTPKPSKLIIIGIFLILYYIGITIILGKHISNSTFTICMFIFTLLQIIETSAYLSMVKILIKSLEIKPDYNQISDKLT